ncbi:MAG: hypothetical protein JXR51_04225 [Bacteroidales bacterium]|nr:hypothetical protein [Bacteroidales bacterium]MBN2756363.1 hypothetical protein [Bacteroidales bacterium]
MINLEFWIETSVIAFVLTIYTAVRNFRLRQKMKEHLGKECYTSMNFIFRHPLITALLNYSVFFIIAFIIKLVHEFIFRQ